MLVSRGYKSILKGLAGKQNAVRLASNKGMLLTILKVIVLAPFIFFVTLSCLNCFNLHASPHLLVVPTSSGPLIQTPGGALVEQVPFPTELDINEKELADMIKESVRGKSPEVCLHK